MTVRLFFVRSPVPGQVKTRLAATVGDRAACRLYRAFGLDMLDALRGDEAAHDHAGTTGAEVGRANASGPAAIKPNANDPATKSSDGDGAGRNTPPANDSDVNGTAVQDTAQTYAVVNGTGPDSSDARASGAAVTNTETTTATSQNMHGAVDLRVFYHPQHEEYLVRRWLGPGLNYAPQRGAGLGERMAAAFALVFGGDGSGFSAVRADASHATSHAAGRVPGGQAQAVSCEGDVTRPADSPEGATIRDEPRNARTSCAGAGPVQTEGNGQSSSSSVAVRSGERAEESMNRDSPLQGDGRCGAEVVPPEAAVLTGSDIPALRTGHLRQAEALLQTHDAVLGPAEDGGYYLIGFRRESFCPQVLREVPLGDEDALQRTLDALRRAGLAVALADPLPDVDTAADLAEQLRRGFLDGTRTRELALRLLQRP